MSAVLKNNGELKNALTVPPAAVDGSSPRLKEAESALHSICGRLQMERFRTLFIRRMLTEYDIAQARKLGRISEHVPETAIPAQLLIICLAERQGWSQNRTIAEIGWKIEVLSELRYRELIEDLGESFDPDGRQAYSNMSEVARKPQFEGSGDLTFEGASIKFKNHRGGSAMLEVLRAFQSEGWPRQISFPIANAQASEMHDIRKRLSLRASKLGLKFSVNTVNRVISWST